MITYVLFLCIIFFVHVLDKISYGIKRKNQSNLNDNILKYSYKHSITHNRIEKNKYSFFKLLAISIIYFFSAFRFDVGWDYHFYYSTIKDGLLSNIISLGEYGTIFLVNLSKKLGVTNLYFAVNSFICIILIMMTIKNYSKDKWVSIIFFVCFPLFYLNSFSVIRMFSALGLTFYGFKYIERKEPMKYILIVILAGMFHKSAFAAILLYFIAHYVKINSFRLVIICLIMPIFSNLFERFVYNFFPRYSIYFRETSIQEGTKAIYVFIVIAIVAILFRKKIIEDDITASLYYNIFFAGLAIYLAFIKQGTLGHRLSLYGTIYSLLLIPKIVTLFKNPLEQLLIKSLIYILCIVMFLYTVNIGAQTYIPYQTIFSIR